MKIPKIIHQIWSGIDKPLPLHFKQLGDTWQEHHPSWQYEFWDNNRMINFIQQFYPQYWAKYSSFKYNIQRWDVIRYLILDRIGGMYVDFDYECIESLDNLVEEKTCCFSSEPKEHYRLFDKELYFNNALMASTAEHPFIKKIIQAVFSDMYTGKKYPDKMTEVLATTGPLILTDLYEKYVDKEGIYIIPAELVSPFSKMDALLFRSNNIDESEELYLEKKLEKAIAVHYFIGDWM